MGRASVHVTRLKKFKHYMFCVLTSRMQLSQSRAKFYEISFNGSDFLPPTEKKKKLNFILISWKECVTTDIYARGLTSLKQDFGGGEASI